MAKLESMLEGYGYGYKDMARKVNNEDKTKVSSYHGFDKSTRHNSLMKLPFATNL
jgi:hypothetical protein